MSIYGWYGKNLQRSHDYYLLIYITFFLNDDFADGKFIGKFADCRRRIYRNPSRGQCRGPHVAINHSCDPNMRKRAEILRKLLFSTF